MTKPKKLITPPSISSLILKGVAIADKPAIEAESLGFTARAMVLATLPHSDPKSPTFTRKNGNFRLTIVAPPHIGLPFGALPRLTLAWVITEAVKTKSPIIELGDSLSAFMRELGLEATGGKNGRISPFKKQLNRLTSSAFYATYDSTESNQGHQFMIVEDKNLWWETSKNPNQQSLWKSNLKLTESFYKEITTKPIPIDMRALKALKSSPMALDLYQWLTYKHYSTDQPTAISWEALMDQFGANYAKDKYGKQNFKRFFKKGYEKVKLVYPNASIKESDNGQGVIILPSKPHILSKR